ncbi:MAG: hypothetical protein M3069_18785 [Chloroflexota bacterium]|nr:hypothetical protein [Chloroflexota bacterium]
MELAAALGAAATPVGPVVDPDGATVDTGGAGWQATATKSNNGSTAHTPVRVRRSCKFLPPNWTSAWTTTVGAVCLAELAPIEIERMFGRRALHAGMGTTRTADQR